jgi:hypothetical protein
MWAARRPASTTINGPQVLVLDYSSLVGPGSFVNPSPPHLNGSAAGVLATTLNAMDETGPFVHFFSIGLNPTLDNPSHTFTLGI